MGFYRKKPVVIQAIEWKWTNDSEIKKFIGENAKYESSSDDFILIIHTLEGDMKASVGDYIIKGVNGEFYPCKPDIFAKTYEPV